jgi:ABC-type sugar transport system ATPase subunit
MANDKTSKLAADLERPMLALETTTFSDGTTLTFEDDDIVVFVGPNNAGKSASLRERTA